MTKYLFSAIMALTSLTPAAHAQDVMCLAVEYTLELPNAQVYASDVLKIIQWTASEITENTVTFEPKEEVISSLDSLVSAKDNIIVEDALLIRDAYYKLLKRNNVSFLAEVKGIKVTDYYYNSDESPIKGAQYLLTYTLVQTDEKTQKKSVYEMTFGITYTYDTCSGEGYTPSESGVKVVTNKEGRVLAIFKKIK